MKASDIAEVFKEISILLQLQGSNPFKVRAYGNGARILEVLEEPIDELIKKKELKTIKGIGKDLGEKITILHTTGTLDFYEELKESTPKGFIEMLGISGLGAKKIFKLNQLLGIVTIAELKKACENGKIAKLAGFGTKTEENLLHGIEKLKEYGNKHYWWDANNVATRIVEILGKLPEVQQISIAGSLRRKKEIVKDIDIVISATNAVAIMDTFTSIDDIESIIAKGETKSSIHLKGGMQVDLRVVPDDQFAFALHHFTGSKEHNIEMRQLALKNGISISEWGLKDKNGDIIKTEIKDETGFYQKFELSYIPPELREGRGEIEAAKKGKIPELIKTTDIKGVFHNHTTESDGKNTLEEMIKAAENLGFEYIGISDHSKSSVQANGLSVEQLLKQIERIEKLNASKKHNIHIFTGVECDILAKGKLDFEDDVLSKLDYVVGSVHSSMSLDEDEMTQRIIKAIENPYITMLGHITGRLLLKRDGYAVHIEKVIDAAIANNTIIEINAAPKRLDMDWRYWKKASERGLICSVNPDAHTTEGLKYYIGGVNIARKGWLTKTSVFNSWSLKQVQSLLQEAR